MSSRVQKGGQKFRPVVAKARPRQAEPSSRQLSTVPESQTLSTPGPDVASLRTETGHESTNNSGLIERNDALQPIDAALNKATPMLTDEVQSNMENAPQKRSAPTIIAVGRSRATPVVAPSVTATATPLPSKPVLDMSVNALPTPPATNSTPYEPSPLPESTPSAPPALPPAVESTSYLPTPVDTAPVDSLLSLLQTLSNQELDSSSLSKALGIAGSQLSLQGNSQTTNSQHNAITQASGVEADPFGSLTFGSDGNPTHQASGSGQAEPSPPKRPRRPRAKKSKENIADPAGDGADHLEAGGNKKRRRSKSQCASQEVPDTEEGAESVKRPKKSGRRRKTSSQATDAEQQLGVLSENDGNATDDASGASPKRKRRKSSTTRKRRSRAPSVPPIDQDADPGEDLDPTAITMSAICSDTGQGRVSSKAAVIQKNFVAWKQQNKEKRARMHAIMEAKKYGRNEDDVNNGETSEIIDINAEATAGPSTASAAEVISEVVEELNPDASDTEILDESGNGFDYSQAVSTSAFNVQVRIGPNGETIIDEESLFVDRSKDAEAETEEYTHIEESDQTKFVNSMSYAKKARGSRWSREETELFFDALQQFGENYELISLVLPGRDRKSCKNKFKAEDKRNSARITECLKNRTPYDITTLSRLTGKDFSGPTPEIRAPEIPRLGSPDARSVGGTERSTPGPSAKPSRKRSRTPRNAEAGVEVVGDVDSFVDMDDDGPGP